MADTLIVEDGFMPDGANAYAHVEAADEWQAARGSSVWPKAPAAGEDPNRAAKEAALIRAADYLNGLRWKGRRAEPCRVMAWPRCGVIDGDGHAVPERCVPAAVVAANCHLAALAYAGTDLQPALERGGSIRKEKVGQLETEYFEGAATRDVFSAVADLLFGLALNLGGEAGAAAALACRRTERG